MPKLEKSTDHSHKLISSKCGQDTSAYKISGQSLHAFSGKCPETSPDGRTDRRTDGRSCRKTLTVGRVDQRTHVQVKRAYFRLRTDGRTDGQPENIMPPAPKGGGITNDRKQGAYIQIQWYKCVPLSLITYLRHKPPNKCASFFFSSFTSTWYNDVHTMIINHSSI